GARRGPEGAAGDGGGAAPRLRVGRSSGRRRSDPDRARDGAGGEGGGAVRGRHGADGVAVRETPARLRARRRVGGADSCEGRTAPTRGRRARASRTACHGAVVLACLLLSVIAVRADEGRPPLLRDVGL